MNLIGHGIYTTRDASLLTRVPAQRIRRCTQGYYYTYKNDQYLPGPVIGSDVRRVDDSLAIDFSDLIEIRFLNTSRSAGMKWSTIHLATERARSPQRGMSARSTMPRPPSTRLSPSTSRTASTRSSTARVSCLERRQRRIGSVFTSPTRCLRSASPTSSWVSCGDSRVAWVLNEQGCRTRRCGELRSLPSPNGCKPYREGRVAGIGGHGGAGAPTQATDKACRLLGRPLVRRRNSSIRWPQRGIRGRPRLLKRPTCRRRDFARDKCPLVTIERLASQHRTEPCPGTTFSLTACGYSPSPASV